MGKVTGIDFTIKIDLTFWLWKPVFGQYCGDCHWLCVRTWTQWHYRGD